MGILIGRGSVRGPARVPDADSSRSGSFGELFFQEVDTSSRFYDRELAVRCDRYDARAVIAAVLQSVEPFDQEIHGFAMADITDNSAHEVAPRRVYFLLIIIAGRDAKRGDNNWPC